MDLRKRLEDAGLDVRSYSGRGMYGAECLGAVARTTGEIFAECPQARIRDARTDSMGLGVVVYWPSIPLEQAP